MLSKRFASTGLRDVWTSHFRRVDDTIEFSFSDKAKLQSRGLEREILIHGVVRNFRSFVVADDGRECRYQHQRALNVFVNLLVVWLGALDQEFTEVHTTV